MYTNNTVQAFNATPTDDERLIAPMATSPFANLEHDRIVRACKASENEQIAYDKIGLLAHAIIHGYYSGHPLVSDEETAIGLLCRYCKRNRAIAKQNIANSKYACLIHKNDIQAIDALLRTIDALSLNNLLEEALRPRKHN